jgi:hypothetical protein
MKPWDRLGLILLACLMVVFVILGLAILPLPFLRDQGIYAYIGWCWSKGLVPYQGAFGHKGPLLYLIYMVSLGISKGAMWGPNLADLASRTLTVILIYFCGKRFFDARTGILAALIVALPLAGVFNSCWWNAQAETFIMPLLVLSLLLAGFSKARYGGMAILFSGIVAAQAVMLKSTAGLHALFLLAYIILGILSGCGAWLLYFILHGALQQLIETLVIFNSFHAGLPGGAGWQEILITGAKGLWTIFGVFLILAAIPLLRTLSKKPVHGDMVILGFFIFSLLQVAFQMKFFLYQWLVLLPSLAMMAARGLIIMFQAYPGRMKAMPFRVLGAGILVLQSILFIRFYFLVLDHYRTLPYLNGDIDRIQYLSRFQEEPVNGRSDLNLLATWRVAHEIRGMTSPDEKVLVFGYEPAIYYFSARLAPTRFHSDYPLTFHPESPRQRMYRQKWRAEFIGDLKADHPRGVILVRNDANALEQDDSYAQAKAFKEFWTWMDENYLPEKSIEDFEIFTRR